MCRVFARKSFFRICDAFMLVTGQNYVGILLYVLSKCASVLGGKPSVRMMKNADDGVVAGWCGIKALHRKEDFPLLVFLFRHPCSVEKVETNASSTDFKIARIREPV